MSVTNQPDLAQALRHNYIFRGLSPEVIAAIARLASLRVYRGGDTLVRQFEQTNDLLIVLEGTARIRSASGDTLAEFGPGSLIGEVALVDNQPRSATVVAVGEVKAAIIPSAPLKAYMNTDAAISSVILGNLARVLCRRLRNMNAHFEAQPPAPPARTNGLLSRRSA